MLALRLSAANPQPVARRNCLPADWRERPPAVLSEMLRGKRIHLSPQTCGPQAQKRPASPRNLSNRARAVINCHFVPHAFLSDQTPNKSFNRTCCARRLIHALCPIGRQLLLPFGLATQPMQRSTRSMEFLWLALQVAHVFISCAFGAPLSILVIVQSPGVRSLHIGIGVSVFRK